MVEITDRVWREVQPAESEELEAVEVGADAVALGGEEFSEVDDLPISLDT